MNNPNSPSSCEDTLLEEENLQIVPTEEKKLQKTSSPWRLVSSMLIIALMLGGGGIWWFSRDRQNQNPQNAVASQPQALPVKIETLNSEIVENSTTVVGTLEAPRAITVKSEVSGRVNEIFITEGARVNAGQVLFTVESDDLQAELLQAQAQLESASARLEELNRGNRPEDIAEARAQLEQAIARLNNAKAGARPEEIAQAQAQITSARAELDLARQRVNRYRNLQKEGAISQDKFDEIVKIERSSLAALTEAQRKLDALTKGRQSDLKELEAAVEESRQNLRRLERGPRIEEINQAQAQVGQAKAAVQMAEVKLNKTQIVAPFAGVVGNIPVKLGDYIDSNLELTTITENNTLEVNLSIPLEQASQLRLGLPIEILNNQGQAITRGQIAFISPDVTPNSQLVLAKAQLQNNTANLFNQSSVQTKIIWEQKPGILVPSAAVTRMGNKSFIFVAEKTGENESPKSQLIAKQTPIILGRLQGNNYQVLDGLEVGQQIVTAGIMNLRDQTPIMPLPPETNQGVRE